jgi:hypothetical protein
MVQATSEWVKRTRLSPLKSVRLYCKTVCGGSAKEVRLCTTADCPLYAYRMGKNPSRRAKWVGPRSRKGRFLPKSDRATGGSLPGKGPEGMDGGSAASIVPSPNGGKSRTSDIEWSNGEVRIKQTSSGMVIRLTQKDQGRALRR